MRISDAVLRDLLANTTKSKFGNFDSLKDSRITRLILFLRVALTMFLLEIAMPSLGE